MALKIKAKERLMKVGKYAGVYRYVMLPELYTSLTQDKVIREAALRSGVSEGVSVNGYWLEVIGKRIQVRGTVN